MKKSIGSILFVALLSWASVIFLSGYVPAQQRGTYEAVSFKTDDGITIRATLGIPEHAAGKLPAVILIHQGGSDRSEWNGFFGKLLAQNTIVLAYDVRGHGESDRVKSIFALFNDPNQAPRDLNAAIGYLRSHQPVDPQRIGVVGASIGANLACVGNAQMGVKTAVAISGKTSAVFNLAGSRELKLKSVFYIASEGDQGGQRAIWARELYERTSPPRKLKIVKNSSAHGVSMFKDDPDLEAEILQWLKQTL